MQTRSSIVVLASLLLAALPACTWVRTPRDDAPRVEKDVRHIPIIESLGISYRGMLAQSEPLVLFIEDADHGLNTRLQISISVNGGDWVEICNRNLGVSGLGCAYEPRYYSLGTFAPGRHEASLRIVCRLPRETLELQRTMTWNVTTEREYTRDAFTARDIQIDNAEAALILLSCRIGIAHYTTMSWREIQADFWGICLGYPGDAFTLLCSDAIMDDVCENPALAEQRHYLLLLHCRVENDEGETIAVGTIPVTLAMRPDDWFIKCPTLQQPVVVCANPLALRRGVVLNRHCRVVVTSDQQLARQIGTISSIIHWPGEVILDLEIWGWE